MKINVKNQDKIETAIKQAEKHCRTRTIDYTDIVSAIEYIEKKLKKMGMRKKDCTGAKFLVQPHCQYFPACYKGIPEGTSFILKKSLSTWFLINCQRMNCNKSYDKNYVNFINENEYQKHYKF